MILSLNSKQKKRIKKINKFPSLSSDKACKTSGMYSTFKWIYACKDNCSLTGALVIRLIITYLLHWA